MKEDNEDEEAEVVSAICSLSTLPLSMFEDINSPRIKSQTSEINPKKKKARGKRENDTNKKFKPPFPLTPPHHYTYFPNTDIRYTYPQLLVDAIGGGDADFLRKIMHQICASGVVFTCDYDGPHNPFGPNHREFVGIDLVTNYYLAMLDSAPDCIMTLSDIVGRRDNKTDEAFLTFNLLAQHTKVSIVVENKASSTSAVTPGAKLLGEQGTASQDVAVDTCGQTQSGDSSTACDITPVTPPPSNTAVDSLVEELTTFTFEKLAIPSVTSYNSARYVFQIDSKLKISRMSTIFKFTSQRPTA